jgi:hypothetical protein
MTPQNQRAVPPDLAPGEREPVLDRDPITSVGTLAADMLELVQRPVVTWRPDQGDAPAIAGRVVAVQTTPSPFGAYPIIDLDDGATVWRVHALGSVFAREVDFRPAGEGVWTTKLAIGDLFAVQDTGERVRSKTAGRDPYRKVTVRHRPAEGAPPATVAQSIGEIVGEIPF